MLKYCKEDCGRVLHMTTKEELAWIKNINLHADKKAADNLIRKYYREIYVYVCKQISYKEDAYDLTQEIFISMLKSISGYDEHKASFRTWLYRIATYKLIDYFRSHKTNCEEYISVEKMEDPISFIENIEYSSYMLSCLDCLSEQILRMKIYGEMTFEEIGKLTVMPESTIKTKYYTALKKLRKDFKNE